MEHGDVARLLHVADADVQDYVEHDDSVLVLLTDDVQRLWTPDGVFAVNDCPQNRSLRPVPDHLKYVAGLDKVPDVAEEAGERPGGPDKPLPELSEGETPEVESGPDYEAWTPKELREACAKRKLPTNGQKPTLIARLQEADAK